ncbi:MAG: ArsR/SmtB family transcription factor [Planctomycetota bacterium]
MSKHAWPRGSRRCCGQLDKALSPAFFRALADPTRLALLVRLAGCRRPATVSELACCTPVDVSVVSRHLAILRDAGMVEARKQGKQVLYTVRYDLVTGTLRGVADAVEACCPDDQCCK